MEHSDEVRVLLVEDDVALAQMYRVKLERDGYTVEVAGDGEAALGVIGDRLPDLIFLDIVSNYSEEELVSRGLQLGALEYLIKSQTTPGQLSQGVPDWTRPYEYPGDPEAEDKP